MVPSFRIAIISLVLTAIVGCNTSGPSPADDTDGGTKRVRVVYIPKNTGNPYFDAIISGFQRAADEFGYDFHTTAPASAEATSQVPFIKDQIQRGIDVLAISPNSPDALNSIFDRARKSGIIVMVVNSDIPGSEAHRDLAVMPMDFNLVGAKNIEIMSEVIDGQGDIAVLSATTDAPDQNFWIEGMKVALHQPQYAGLNLVDIVYGDDDPQKSTVEAEGLLAKYPNLRGIISPTSVGIAATAQVIELAGLYPGGPNATGDGLELTGMGTPNEMRRFIKEGIVEKFFAWDPSRQGYIAGYLAVEMVAGRIKPEPGVTFEMSDAEIGRREFRDNNVLIAGSAIVLEKQNIDDWHF